MRQLTARVRDGALSLGGSAPEHVIAVGGSAWQGWLEEPSNTVFGFEHLASRFTARRELQRGHWYWYAYRRRGGRLRKAYLGRSSDLTLERLTEVAGGLEDAAVEPPRGRVQPAPARKTQ